MLNQKIVVLPGLRATSKSFAEEVIKDDSKESETKAILTPYFTAAKFLKEIAILVTKNEGIISETILQDWYQNYFGQGKCYIGDPTRGDFDTKQQLLDDAWNLFINEKLYLKIQELVSYSNATEIKSNL